MWLSLTASLRDMFDPDTLETDNPEPPKKFWVGFTVSFDRAWTFIRHLLGLHTLALCLLLGASPALAADTICGVDTDENGTYGLACTGISDGDRDGILTSVDCDDTNRYIVPGTFKDDSGTLKMCAADGTWTTIGTWPSGVDAGKASANCGTVKFVDPAGSTTDNTCGAHGTPCDYRCFSTSNGLGCSQTLTAGTCVFFLTGNYTGHYTSTSRRQIWLNNIDGTSGNEIKFIGVVGQAATITGQGTSGNPADIAKFEDSNYIWIQNLEITGGVGGHAIHISGGTYNKALANHVHDFTNYQNDNHSGIAARVDATGAEIKWNVVHDNNYPTGSEGDQDHSNQILIMDIDDYTVNYNVAYCDGTDCRGIIDKHGAGGATTKEMIGNVVYGMERQGIVGASRHLDILNNYIADTGQQAIAILNIGGGDLEFGDILVKNNTVNGTFPLIFTPENNAPAETYALEVIDNIFIDDKATAYDGNDGFYRLCHYCSDSMYTSYITGNQLHFDNNGVYNSAGTALYETVWGDAGSGASGTTYSTCGTIVAGTPTHTNTPCTTGNQGTDPAINSMQVATTSGLTDAGWNVNWPGTGTTSTTTTTTTTTTSIVATNIGGLAPRYQ